MIAYAANPVVQPPAIAAAPSPAPSRRPPPLTREAFIVREAANRHVYTEATPDGLGVVRWGIRHVALPCHVDSEHNPGWVLVRDDPFAIAHYQRLFGEAASGRPVPEGGRSRPSTNRNGDPA